MPETNWLLTFYTFLSFRYGSLD